MIEPGRSYEYRSTALNIIFVVLDGDRDEGWDVLILFNDHAKPLGFTFTAGDVANFNPNAVIANEAVEVGSVPPPGVR